jgi:hypothetical protein
MADNPDRKTFKYNVPPISDDQLYDLEVSVDETHSFGLFVRYDFYAIMARLREAEAERDRMREALKPFAERAAIYDPPDKADDASNDWYSSPPHIKIRDFRRARKLVEGGE